MAGPICPSDLPFSGPVGPGRLGSGEVGAARLQSTRKTEGLGQGQVGRRVCSPLEDLAPLQVPARAEGQLC